jgi:glycosyltransferase involved in cell wall biosynthesis
MNIFIITNEPFPIGMAATNRLLSLARGYVENNAYVKVICIRTGRSEVNKSPTGNVKGIEYEYSCGTTEGGKNILERRLLRLKALVRALTIIGKSCQRNQGDAIISQSRLPLHVVLFFLEAKALGLKYLIDQSEYPYEILDDEWFTGWTNKSLLGKIYAWMYTSFMYKFYDAMLVMTKALQEYFRGRVRRGAELLLVPMTVEMDRFDCGGKVGADPSRYIAYCGDVGGKDGVPILIQSFARIAEKHPAVKLYIIGDTANPTILVQLKDLVASLGVQSKVVFTGRVSRDEIPRYLCNAEVLALARPRSLQATGGFPIKLGEYLSTGNPVVITKVGEIPEYLMDQEDAFLCEPDSVEAFAEKLDFVLSHPNIAKEVGRRGKDVAGTHFSYQIQSKKIIEFLQRLHET